MSISDFIPTLQPMVERLSIELRFICYFVLTASLIVRMSSAQHHGGASTLMRPIITVTVITGLIASLPFWFNLVRDTFWEMAMTIRQEFASSIAPTGSALLQLLKPPQDGINWLDITDSLMKAVLFALGWLAVGLGAIIQIPMMLFQYVMECLCYLFLPIALALFALESTKGIALRYLQQTLAILAWPIGFAVVDLVGYSLLTSVPSLVDASLNSGSNSVHFTPNNFLIGGLVAVWLILGSLATPVIMQMLFCSGSPLSSLVGQALQMGLMAAGMMRLKAPTPSPSSQSASPTAQSNSSSGGNGGSGPNASPSSPPPPTPPSPQAASTAQSATATASTPPSSSPRRGHTQPVPQSPLYDPLVDPTGDRHSADLMAMSQVYQPVHY